MQVPELVSTNGCFDVTKYRSVIKGKGSIPYEKITDLQYLMGTVKFPEKDEFYNKLTATGISDEDYAEAKLIWEKHGFETMYIFFLLIHSLRV